MKKLFFACVLALPTALAGQTKVPPTSSTTTARVYNRAGQKVGYVQTEIHNGVKTVRIADKSGSIKLTTKERIPQNVVPYTNGGRKITPTPNRSTYGRSYGRGSD